MRLLALLVTLLAACDAADTPRSTTRDAPPIVSPAGLVALPCDEAGALRAASGRYCRGEGRNWLTPLAAQALAQVAERVARAFPGTWITYMDASWPSGVRPMPPHLSHGDGRQVDVALFYVDRDGHPLPGPPTPNGYGAFEPPRDGEARPCASVRRPGPNEDPPAGRAWRLDTARTALLIRTLVDDPRVARILIEPHLEARLGFAGHPKLRFPGCHAMRHDGHAHVEFARAGKPP